MEAFLSVYLPIILCGLFGLALVTAEMFLPGFGLPGITGALLEIGSIVFAYLKLGSGGAVCVTLILLALDAIALSISLRSISKGRLSKSPVVLNDEERPEDVHAAEKDVNVFIGHEGRALTPLRPVGMVDLNGVRLNASADGEFIAKDAAVVVSRVDGTRIIVKRKPE